jgi:hypothetical protein
LLLWVGIYRTKFGVMLRATSPAGRPAAGESSGQETSRRMSGELSGQRADPSIDMKTPVREQVEAMDTMSFFKLLAELMKQNPPFAADAPILARLARIGLVPGQDFDLSKLASVPNIQEVPKLGIARVVAHFPENTAFVAGLSKYIAAVLTTLASLGALAWLY